MSSIMVVVAALFVLSLASVGFIALKNRTMFKIGLRNLPRRGLQTLLVVMGLMLATLIITAAFTTGDTVDYSIKNLAFRELHRSDLSVRFNDQAEGANPVYFSQNAAAGIEAEFTKDDGVAGTLPFLFEPVAARDERTKLSEPNVRLAGVDTQRLSALGGLTATSGDADVLTLTPGDVLLTDTAAENLDAQIGDTVNLFSGEETLAVTVVGIVQDEFASGGRNLFDDPNGPGGAVVTIEAAQTLTGHQDQINFLTIALNGGVEDSYKASPDVAPRIEEFLRSSAGADVLGVPSSTVEVEQTKLDAVDKAEQFGNMFVTFFMVCGLFSIASGLMLIFMIFVMMAAERRAEMGISRAVGAQRGNLVQAFVAEGMAYNLIAGAVGSALGVGAALALIVGLLKFGLGEGGSFIAANVTTQSLVISYCIGVVVTFLTVVFSAIKVSNVDIVAAIRGTAEDEPPAVRQSVQWRWVLAGVPALVVPPLGLWVILRKGFHLSWAWILSVAGVALGLLAMLSAKSSASEFMFSFGFLAIPFSIALLATHYKAPARLVWTVFGAMLAGYWLSPVSIGEQVIGKKLEGDIEMFVLSGLMVVVAFTLIIVYNARFLTALLPNGNGRYRVTILAAATAIASFATGVTVGDSGDGVGQLAYLAGGLCLIVAAFAFAAVRFPRLAPAIKMGVAYPLSNRFRTGMTIAMFSLIVFSLTTFSSVNANFARMLTGDGVGSDWDIIASANRNSDVSDLRAVMDEQGLDQAGDMVASGQVTLYTGSQQVRQGDGEWRDYPVIAADEGFLGVPELDARAEGYETDEAAFAAVQSGDYALIDWPGTSDNHNDAWDWTPDVSIKDKSFAPFTVAVRDPATGRSQVVTVIGVLPLKLNWDVVAGIYVNERVYSASFGAPDYQRTYLQLKDGIDAQDAARGIEAALATQGVQASSIDKLIKDSAAQDMAFTRVFEGFMALGLFVGVAALGVVAFRSVVERRQQIGMLRAIGYQSGTVAMTFVMESTFVALMGILSGVVGGVIVTHNIFTIGIFSGESVSFFIPWTEIIGFAGAAFVVSLFMTWLPSRNAAHVPVADALRYE
jgi:putative ABC transport system permease protein